MGTVSPRLRNTKAKREEDLLAPATHKQVEIEGQRSRGSHWKLVCDEGIVPLIRKLNELDYNTLFSCQGSESGADEYSPAYIALRYPTSEIRYTRLIDIIKQYYKDRIIQVMIDAEGVIGFYMWHPYDFAVHTADEDFTAHQIIIYEPKQSRKLVSKIDKIEKRLQSKN